MRLDHLTCHGQGGPQFISQHNCSAGIPAAVLKVQKKWDRLVDKGYLKPAEVDRSTMEKLEGDHHKSDRIPVLTWMS